MARRVVIDENYLNILINENKEFRKQINDLQNEKESMANNYTKQIVECRYKDTKPDNKIDTGAGLGIVGVLIFIIGISVAFIVKQIM